MWNGIVEDISNSLLRQWKGWEGMGCPSLCLNRGWPLLHHRRSSAVLHCPLVLESAFGVAPSAYPSAAQRLAPVPIVSLLALCLTGRTTLSSCCTQSPALECHLSLILSAKNNEMNATQEKDLKLVESHIPRAMVKSCMSKKKKKKALCRHGKYLV